MNKVMWLLDRASYLTPGEFHDWWLIRHTQDIISDQAPHRERYIVDVRVADVDDMAGTPDYAPEWDGMQGHGVKPQPTTAPHNRPFTALTPISLAISFQALLVLI